MENLFVWNGRVADAVPTKREAFVAARHTVKKTAGSCYALEVRGAEALTVVVERGCVVNLEDPEVDLDVLHVPGSWRPESGRWPRAPRRRGVGESRRRSCPSSSTVLST
jgi:hypothetical protein